MEQRQNNMKTEVCKSHGLELPFSVADSIEEFDQLAKREGACLDEANRNIIYRGPLAEFRSKFATYLEGETGVKRNVKDQRSRTDGTKVDILEAEGAYFRRLADEHEVELESHYDKAKAIATACEFDPSVAESKGPVDKVGKEDRAVAEGWINGGKAEKAATSLGSLLGRIVEPTVEALALAIKDKRRKDLDAQKARLESELGVA